MNNRMKLDVMICTLGADGLRRVQAMTLPRLDGVRYVVSCQDPNGDAASVDLSDLKARGDIIFSFIKSRGLSRNRNNAMSLARAEYALIADDDLLYTADQLRAVIDTLDSHHDTDVAAFRYTGHDGNFAKIYPTAEHDLSQDFPHYYITSFEIALRTDSIRRKGLMFSELVGLGAPYLSAGEEALFVRRCILAGLHCRFYPITIVTHPGPTTATSRAAMPGVIRAKGATMRLLRGNLTALTRLPVEAWRAKGSKLKALLYLIEGYIYSIIHSNRL